ncbi:hypothetical protein, partial [Shewanella baltica]|uniref:hypothetical protein n=1 Tax=Shewanella baltica TaxID=62322 RepID=UPI0024BAE2D5
SYPQKIIKKEVYSIARSQGSLSLKNIYPQRDHSVWISSIIKDPKRSFYSALSANPALLSDPH